MKKGIASLALIVSLSACGSNDVDKAKAWDLTDRNVSMDLGNDTGNSEDLGDVEIDMNEGSCNFSVKPLAMSDQELAYFGAGINFMRFEIKGAKPDILDRLRFKLLKPNDLFEFGNPILKIETGLNEYMQISNGRIEEDYVVFEGLDIEFGEEEAHEFIVEMDGRYTNEIDGITQSVKVALESVGECETSAESTRGVYFVDRADLLIDHNFFYLNNKVTLPAEVGGVVLGLGISASKEPVVIRSFQIVLERVDGLAIDEDYINSVELYAFSGGHNFSFIGLTENGIGRVYSGTQLSMRFPDDGLDYVEVIVKPSYTSSSPVSVYLSKFDVVGVYSGNEPNTFYESEKVEPLGFSTDPTFGFVSE